MLRLIVIGIFLLLAGVAFLAPFPYYLLHFRGVRAEYETKYEQWQEKQLAWREALKKENEDRRGSAVKVLTRGTDGDIGIYLIGNVAARLPVSEAREAQDEFWDEAVVPLIGPFGRARTSMTILAFASVILTTLLLLAGIVTIWRGGILKGLLTGFLVGLLVGVPLAAWWGWLVLKFMPLDYLIASGVIFGGALLAGFAIGVVGRIAMRFTSKTQTPAGTEATL